MKSYEEIAKSVFERREKHLAKQKKRRGVILKTVASAVCCSIVIGAAFGVWKSGLLSSAFSTPSNGQSTSSATESVVIDSLDKLNFYAAKKVIEENSLFLLSEKVDLPDEWPHLHSGEQYAEFPIDKDAVFTVTMATYFTIWLNDQGGFLAQKLGGMGLVEVVICEIDIYDHCQIMTFKKGDNYYSCLVVNRMRDPENNVSFSSFYTNTYIDGFNLVKNFNQENFCFTVGFKGDRVMSFHATYFNYNPDDFSRTYRVDDVTFISDPCLVIYNTKSFTIDQLEGWIASTPQSQAAPAPPHGTEARV